MKSFTRFWLAWTITSLLAGVIACPKRRPPVSGEGGLFLRVAEGGPAPADKVVVRGSAVQVDVTLLRGEQQALPAVLFDDVKLRLVRDRVERTPSGGLLWFGRIENEPGSSAIFSLKGEAVAGTIRTQAGKLYRIRFAGRGIHRVEELDPSKFAPEAEPLPALPRPTDTEADTCATDPPSDIDVLVVYTATARAAAGGVDAMEATVFLAVAETNQAYINSNVNQRIRLAHLEEVAYTETGNSLTDLNAIRNTSDGVIDNVLTLRNSFAADCVVMIVESLDACGRGSLMSTVSNAFEASAYAVVQRGCGTGNFSFGHELGHNMAARHDWTADPTNNSPNAFNHGHIVTAPTATGVGPWRTIMSYNSSCVTLAGVNCTRIQNFSNPNVNFPPGVIPTDATGTATGTQQTDNAQTLNNTALTVANFRCSSPGVPNVWMKDTWNDSGQEPDPDTAAEPMWRSPYIWVRNSQDVGLVNQHIHQNPEIGASNFAYVKLHNGSTSPASGNLELYFANASVSLNWPTAWTPIGTVAVTGFAAGSTRVVEQAWTNLPTTPGHYCLLARWVSPTDPMATAEGPDINANVRANNNLVWRNMDIVDLQPDESADVFFSVRNSSRERAIGTLLFRGPTGGRQPSFLEHGEVVVKLDDKLAAAWKEGGGKGTGQQGDKEGIRFGREGGRLENLVLPPGFEGRVTVRLRRLPTTPRRDFGLDIEYQTSGKTVGGVSYEIHTDRRK
jgi:hypothetical protein